ncbi:MAG: hypothetical protein JW984_05120 [Deltaproteobacteria bacterium]|uniref:TFIIB-type zinc ribbon-containing protein n=1 Tax=Candidatus Zymogenus saltonus TaxID=2844893 RepID=A0A9D8KEF7_9DELT|nr:hypothetical protein [Candidatus Zymogenus saltonus]
MSKVKLTAAKCPNCGGTLKIEKGSENALCKYCGSTVLIDEVTKKSSTAEKPVKVIFDFRRFYKVFGSFGCVITLIFLFAFIAMLTFMGFIGVFSGFLAHILSRFGI